TTLPARVFTPRIARAGHPGRFALGGHAFGEPGSALSVSRECARERSVLALRRPASFLDGSVQGDPGSVGKLSRRAAALPKTSRTWVSPGRDPARGGEERIPRAFVLPRS